MSNIIVQEDIDTILHECEAEFSMLGGNTVLLTGGSGFVGSTLVESVIEYNRRHKAKPCVLLLPTRSLERTRKRWPEFFGMGEIRWFEWDGRNLEPSSAICDYVIHGAASADPTVYLSNPLAGMQEVVRSAEAALQFARHSGVKRFLYLSSGAVYGEQPADLAAIAEDFTGSPSLNDQRSCYGEAKRYCELLCQVSGLPIVVARLFSFAGPYLDMNASFAVADFIRQADKHRAVTIHGDGGALRTYCYSTDLAIALWKLLLQGSIGAAYNVGARGPEVSILDVATAVSEIMDTPAVRLENNNGTDRRRYVPDISRLETIYSPRVPFRTALTRTIHSLQERGIIGSVHLTVDAKDHAWQKVERNEGV